MDNCIIIICACELIMVKVNIYKIMSISQIASSYLLEHKTHLSHRGRGGGDVSLNKPFIPILRKCRHESFAMNHHLCQEESANVDYKIHIPLKQDIISWVNRGIEYLRNSLQLTQERYTLISSTGKSWRKLNLPSMMNHRRMKTQVYHF